MARRRAGGVSYVVQRLAIHPWRWSAEPTLSVKGSDEHASFVPLEGLRTKKQAEARCRQLEAEARRATAIGPFLPNLLPSGAPAIAAAIAGAGLPQLDLSAIGPAVEPEKFDYGGGMVGYSYGQDYSAYSDRVEAAIAAWLEQHVAEVTPQQNAALWDVLFPEHCFYTVQKVRIEEEE
jgi:hypothetical protein